MNLNKFKLNNEDDTHFHLSHPNGKKIKVEKQKLSEKAHNIIKGLKVQGFDEGGDVKDSDGDAIDISGPQSVPANAPIPAKEQDATPSPQSSGVSGSWSSAPQPSTAAPTNASSGELQQQPVAPQQMLPGMTVSGALESEKKANTALSGAESEQGMQEKRAIENTQSSIDKMPSQKDIIDANKQKDESLFKSYQDQKIDPNRYYHSMGTGQKIAAGLGMILSGAGSGVTGGPNIAATMIQNAIERDIQAQKSDKESKYNLWKMNREALGSDLAANIATQNQMYTGLKYNLLKAQSQFRGPQAQARAQMANALIDNQIAQNRFKMSLMNGPTQEQRDPASVVPWLVPDSRQKEVFDEISRAQDTRKMGDTILKSFDDASKENTILKTGAGLLRTPASVLALHQSMQPTFKDLEGTVRQAAMDNTFRNITPSPGDAPSTIATKRAALVDYLNSKTAAPTAKGFGIDLDRYQSTQAPQQGPQIKTMNGIPYMKVPGGWVPKK